MPPEIGANPAFLTRTDGQPAALDLGTYAETLEPQDGAAEVFLADGLDDDIAVGHGRQSDEAADLDVIRPDGVRGAAERPAALDGVDVGPDAGDLRAHCYEAAGQILN